MLRVGIVAEGRSDWLVLQEAMKIIHSDIEFVTLRPDHTLASGSPFGWKGVRAWCREYGPKLEVLMTGVVGRSLDLIVIHADCSMAHNEAAARPCPPASDTARALREVILSSWLGRSPTPPFLVLANPSKTTDAWVVATLDPAYPKLTDIECDIQAEDELVRRRLLRRRDGEVKKPERAYLPLAQLVGERFSLVCELCAQASAFRMEFSLAVIWSLWMG